VKLTLDHHYATAIAVELRTRGHDVTTALERGWHAEGDQTLLHLCREDGRALLTNNVANFTTIAARWQSTGRSHAGIVFSSDASMPRSKRTIGLFVTALDTLLTAEPDGITDQVRWLQPPRR
jgi:Domain of unknown function (DUF5615)